MTTDMTADLAGLRMAAQRMESAADILCGALGPHVRGLNFDAALAGRSHGEAGAALRIAVDRLVAGAVAAAAESRDVAHTLRGCADRYSHCDESSAETLR